MANSKKIHIRTVTIERYLITGGAPASFDLFCAGCGLVTEMLRIGPASVEAGLSMRDLFRLSERGVIHSIETQSGQIMFCRRSLRAFCEPTISEG